MIEFKFHLFNNGELKGLAGQWWARQLDAKPLTPLALSPFQAAISDDKDMLALTHIYAPPNCAMVMVAFTITNPDVPPFLAGRALSALHDATEKVLVQMGVKLIYTSYDRSSLQRMLERKGYVRGSDAVEYIKRL